MTNEFKIPKGLYLATSIYLGCEVAVIKAIAANESKNSGFDEKGRPVILFERHKFYKYAGKNRNAWFRLHPDICNPDAGGYGTTASQWGRFTKAFNLNKEAAMMACSWGAFQEMGFNYDSLGFDNVGQFVDAMKLGVDAQFAIFVKSIRVKGLVDEMRAKDFTTFARLYNGAGFRKNDYDNKMRRSYEAFKNEDFSSVTPIPLMSIAELKEKVKVKLKVDELTASPSVVDDDDLSNNPANNTAINNATQTAATPTVAATEKTGFISKLWTAIVGILTGTIALPAFVQSSLESGSLKEIVVAVFSAVAGVVKANFTVILASVVTALVVYYVTKKVNNYYLTKMKVETGVQIVTPEKSKSLLGL